MAVSLGNLGGGGGGALWTEDNWIPLTIATMITSQLHLITDKIVPICSPDVGGWWRALAKFGEDQRWCHNGDRQACILSDMDSMLSG